MTIRVVLADDQVMIRDGFRLVIGTQPDMEIVAEAANGREAVDACVRHRPDVCLLDIRMPLLDGLAATESVITTMGDDAPAIVIVTTFDLDEYVYRAFRAGARGFITKESGAMMLVSAIRAAADGGALASPEITVRLIEHFATRDRRSPPDRLIASLTERERAVLIGVASGLTNEELAARDYVSLSTVKTHVAHLMTKLECRNRVELTIYAYEHGLVGGS